MYCNNKYSNITNFGKDTCHIESEPLAMCLADNMDKKFMNGGIARLFGPKSFKCEAFMAERCSKNYDGYCEYFYRNYNKQNSPITQPYPNSFNPKPWASTLGVQASDTIGNQFLQNVAELKYCTYANCLPVQERFNPLDPNSPMITYYQDPTNTDNICIPICNKIDVKTIDSDPVMNRLLENPAAAPSTLINICNTAKNNKVDLSGTKLGRVCGAYHSNMNILSANSNIRRK